MVYNPKLGAMSSPFGENPNEGSIAKEDPNKLPPPEDRPTSPSTIADMIDKEYGKVMDGHNNAQDALSGKKKPEPVIEVKSANPETEVKEEGRQTFTKETKSAVLSAMLAAGAEIKQVYDDIIVVNINGQDITICQE